MVLLAVGSFSLCGFPSVQFLPYQAFAEGKMMTGASHHLSPAWVIIDNRLKARKAFPSIAGAKIRSFSVSTKMLHVIRSDFQQLTIWSLVKNPNSMFYGAHLYVFRYGKLCFVI